MPASSSSAPEAWIRLRGHEALAATAELIYQNPRTRMTRATLILLGCWIIAPIAFIVPPHIPWAVLAFGGGLYLAVRQWRGEYLVNAFSGECPRCHAALRLAPGTKIRLPYAIDCFQCHHEPVLEIGPVAESPGG